MKTFNTLADFRKAHKEAGMYFFERKTMNFFRSRIESGLLKGKYFITSEKFSDSAPRKYTIREIQDDLQVKTIGHGFNDYRAKADAKEALNRIILTVNY